MIWLPRMAAWILAAALGLKAAELVWQLIPAQLQTTPPPPPASIEPVPSQANSTLNISALTSAHLFGEYSADTPEPQPVALNLDAPETNLRLTLRGIVAMEDSERSRALIETSSGDLNPFAIGSTVISGAVLHAIYADRVLLRRGGRLETLRLEKDAPSSTQGRAGYAQNANRASASGAARVLDSGTAAKLSNIRTELLNDPTKASQYLRVQPARRNGAMRGYRIYPGRKRELFREAGLRPGDIVTAINGVTLDDPSRSLQLLGDLSSAQLINLQIERGGQSQTVSVNLN